MTALRDQALAVPSRLQRGRFITVPASPRRKSSLSNLPGGGELRRRVLLSICRKQDLGRSTGAAPDTTTGTRSNTGRHSAVDVMPVKRMTLEGLSVARTASHRTISMGGQYRARPGAMYRAFSSRSSRPRAKARVEGASWQTGHKAQTGARE